VLGAGAGHDLHAVRDALQRAAGVARHASGNVDNTSAQRHLVEVTLATEDVNAAIALLDANPAKARLPPTPPTVTPDFTVPATYRGHFPGRETVLENLVAAFDALKRAPGGDLGGLRTKIYGEIAAAALDVIRDIDVEARRRESADSARPVRTETKLASR